jgi:hypothetical protein
MRRGIAALALIALAAGLVACGASGPADPIASAASKSEKAGGARITTRVTVSFPSGGQGVITGEGTFDQLQGEMTLDMSNLLQNSPLPIGSGSGIKARYLQEAGLQILYLQLPFLASALPKGKTWVRLDLEHTSGSAVGANFSELLGQAGQNPTQAVDMLRATGPATKVGPDIVGGVRATEYHATIDLRKALELKGVYRSGIRRLLASGAPSKLPVDVWIGEDGLVHQLRMTSTSTMSGQKVSTATLTTMSDWGTTVFVDPPPHDQVFDAANTATAANTA